MTLNLNRILMVAALICLVVAWIITVGWVSAAGDARDGWLVGGLALFVAAHLA